MSEHDSKPPDGFRLIPGFPRYAIDENGTILSICGHVKERTRPWSKARRLKPTLNPYGYLAISLCRNGKVYLKRVHVLVLATFIGPCAAGMQSRHLDGNKQNNHLSNLKWGTATQNYEDMQRHGTNPQGERHGNAKLTEDDVREIRKRRDNGAILVDVATEFNISFSTVSRISRREAWAHVQGE